MAKKDYILIAAALKAARVELPEGKNRDPKLIYNNGVDNAAHYVADALGTQNPLFDRARFLTACGVAPSVVRINAPAAWASAIVNGDRSGLSADEIAVLDHWLAKQDERWPGVNFVSCGSYDGDEGFFSRHWDLYAETRGWAECPAAFANTTGRQVIEYQGLYSPKKGA